MGDTNKYSITVWKNKTFSLALITKYFVKAAFSVTVWKKEKFTAMPRNFFSSNQFGTRLKQLV